MGLWGQLRSLLFARDDQASSPTANADVAPAVDTSMRRQIGEETIASRQECAASRVLDDERLRGDLADDEYQPLLDWALAEADRAAVSTEALDDAEADAQIDRRLQVIREVVQAAAAAIVAHAEGDAARRSSELAFIGRESSSSDRLQALARRLDAEPDLSGPEIATLIVGELERSPEPPTSPSNQEGSP